jgi:hypothetical protein
MFPIPDNTQANATRYIRIFENISMSRNLMLHSPELSEANATRYIRIFEDISMSGNLMLHSPELSEANMPLIQREDIFLLKLDAIDHPPSKPSKGCFPPWLY